MRKRDLRELRLQAAKRQPFEIAANDETPITWGDFYAETETTDESYALEQIASANSGTEQINWRTK